MNTETTKVIRDSKLIEYRDVEFKLGYFLRHAPGPAAFYLHGLGGSKDDFLRATQADHLRNYFICLEFRTRLLGRSRINRCRFCSACVK